MSAVSKTYRITVAVLLVVAVSVVVAKKYASAPAERTCCPGLSGGGGDRGCESGVCSVDSPDDGAERGILEIDLGLGEASADATATTLPAATVTTTAPSASTGETPARITRVRDVYPFLTTGPLAAAKLAKLPEGVVLRMGDATVTAKEVDDTVAKTTIRIRKQYVKNLFFVLETVAMPRLLLAEAKLELAKAGKDVLGKSDQEIADAYGSMLAAEIKVTDAEIKEFYDKNPRIVGIASLARAKPSIRKRLLNMRRDALVATRMKTIAERTTVEISAAWTAAGAISAQDNPVDRARASGLPSMIHFGAAGCHDCDLMQPVLKNVGRRYAYRFNVVFVSVRKEPVLAHRYEIQSIPVQIFFDARGKEVLRHIRYMSQSKVEAQIAKMGVVLE